MMAAETTQKNPKAKRGLGKGLSALLGDESVQPGGVGADGSAAGPRQVPIEYLKPSRFQPRQTMELDALEELAASIRDKGVLQPILVRSLEADAETFEIIAGERRWRAAQQAGLHAVPVVVKDMDDQEAMEIALVENLQRQDLSPLEEAEGFRSLMEEFSHTQEDLARAVGKSRSHVANTLRLLGLPDGVKVYLGDGRLSAGHARALVNVDNAEHLAKMVVDRGLNVRQTEKLAKGNPGPGRPKGSTARQKDNDTLSIERDLSLALGLKVEINDRGGQGGSLNIHYSTLDQLDDILAKLTG
ncbi:MAG: ParB/RepB/Spo0J family partition protein [Magnetovibrionaceae bacterium]